MACKYCSTKITTAAPCRSAKMAKTCSERWRLEKTTRHNDQLRRAAEIINRVAKNRDESDHTLGADCAVALQDAGIIQ